MKSSVPALVRVAKSEVKKGKLNIQKGAELLADMHQHLARINRSKPTNTLSAS